MKKNIYLYEKKEYFKIEKLVKCNNGDQFFKKIKKMMCKNNENCSIDIETLAQHYQKIFNRPLNVSDEVINAVNDELNDVSIENFRSINITMFDVNLALKLTNSSNTIGNDGISARMIKNCNNKFTTSSIFYIFRFIFHYGVIPAEMNITHIVPIKKDKSKSINDIKNLRPISISNTLAQIFERIMMMKIKSIYNTHDNQFGYKNKTSCSHALFVFKETIISFLENKQHCFAVFLDAIKAFDNLWRSGLYVKMKRGKILLSYIILLRIYYDKLVCKIKIGYKLSRLFKLARGVKQGGVMSGALFNYYINDLIEECFQSGVGAKFIEILVAIIVFCDDICLLSHNKEDMQIFYSIYATNTLTNGQLNSMLINANLWFLVIIN